MLTANINSCNGGFLLNSATNMTNGARRRNMRSCDHESRPSAKRVFSAHQSCRSLPGLGAHDRASHRGWESWLGQTKSSPLGPKITTRVRGKAWRESRSEAKVIPVPTEGGYYIKYIIYDTLLGVIDTVLGIIYIQGSRVTLGCVFPHNNPFFVLLQKRVEV